MFCQSLVPQKTLISCYLRTMTFKLTLGLQNIKIVLFGVISIESMWSAAKHQWSSLSLMALGLFWYLEVFFYQYLHWQLLHIITKHLTSGLRISDTGKEVPSPHYTFSEITHCSQMCPGPWSTWGESPTRIRSSFYHRALKYFPRLRARYSL